MTLWKYTFAQLWKQVASIWKPFPDSWITFPLDPNSFEDARRRNAGDPRQIRAAFLPGFLTCCVWENRSGGPAIFSVPDDPSGSSWSLCFLRLISLLNHCPMASTVCGLNRGSAFPREYWDVLPRLHSARLDANPLRFNCMYEKRLSKHFPFISQSNGLARAAGLHPVNPIVLKRISEGLDRSSMGCMQALLSLCG